MSEIEPTQEEQKAIIDEVIDHANHWGSDRAKRITVESHLERPSRECHPGRQPMKDAVQKVEWMVKNGKIQFAPGRCGGYLLCPTKTN